MEETGVLEKVNLSGFCYLALNQVGNTERSTTHSLACRLVQIILALYLIPAVLIAFLVGALGIMIVAVASIVARLQGTTTS